MKTLLGISFALGVFASVVPNANAAEGDTLKAVQQRGVLNCTTGDSPFEGFFEVDGKGNWHGIDIDYCRAVATAIFGNDENLKLIPTSWAQRFPSLQSGALDVVIEATSWTMGRDTELGVQFSIPYFMGATTFMAHKELNAKTLSDLQGGVICTSAGTSIEKLVADYLKKNKIDMKVVTYTKTSESQAAYVANRCDVLASFAPGQAAARLTLDNPDDHVILPDPLAIEPQAAAVRQGDDAWLDIVNWVIAIGIIAEENDVTSANVDQLKANPPSPTIAKLLGVTPGIGSRLALSDDWAYRVIKATGNFGEIYDRNLGANSSYKLPRGANALWKNGGVFYAPTLD